MKSPLPIFRRGLYDIGDHVSVPLICPTRQVGEQFFVSARGHSDETKFLDGWHRSQRPIGSLGGRRCISLPPCSRFCQAYSMPPAITRSVHSASRCANMAARFVTIRFSCLEAPVLPPFGAHSSACAEAQRTLKTLAMMPVCP